MPSVLEGEWNIDVYEIYYEENGEVITDLRYEDVGEFILRENGAGNATIAIPGSALPQNQPISWFFNEAEEQVTIDYGTMEDPYTYDVEIISLSDLKWISERNGVLTTITLSKK